MLFKYLINNINQSPQAPLRRLKSGGRGGVFRRAINSGNRNRLDQPEGE
jgi:hypothetical protein